jgi:hypothetical protein
VDPHALILVHAALTWFLTGLIWVVQLVHYPLFAHVAPDAFPGFARDHGRRITWIVAPAMAAELLTGLWLPLALPPGGQRTAAVLGAALIALIWISTAAVQVPCHRRLGRGFDAAAHARLVRSNWVRTVAWTARAGLVAAVLAGFLGTSSS